MRPATVTAVAVVSGRVLCAHFERRPPSELVLCDWSFEAERSPVAGTFPDAGLDWKPAHIAFGPGCRRSGSVSVVLPPALAVVRRLKVPRLSEAQQAQLLSFEVGQWLGITPSQATWAMAKPMPGESHDLVQVVAAPTERFERWAEACANSAGRIDAMEPGCLALYRGFRYNRPGMALPFGLVDVHGRGLRVLVGDEAGYSSRHALWPTGSSGTAPPWAPSQLPAVSVLAERVHLELARLFAGPDLAGEKPRPALGGVQVTGEWAVLPEFTATLAERLGVPVEVYDPLGGVTLRGRVPSAEERAGMAEVVGLAARGLAPAPALELLPAAERARRRRSRQRPFVVGALAALLLAPLPPGIALAHRAQALDRERHRLEGVLAPLVPWERAIKLALAERDRLQGERDAWLSLHAARRVWPGFLDDLETRLAATTGLGCESLHLARDGGVAEPPTIRLGGVMELDGVEGSGPAAMRAMLTHLTKSPYIERVESERFDSSDARRLGFEVVLKLRMESWLQ